MKVQEFVDKAIRLADKTPTKYYRGGWGQQENGYYLFDCICWIKSVLWGFNFEKGGHGGAVYASNGVPDKNANQFFENYCYDKSTDFTNLEVGDMVYMEGHIGFHIGNRIIVEATSAWEGGVLRTYIHTDGRRSRNNIDCYDWEYHCKCKFIEYPPKEVPRKYEAGQTVLLNGYTHKSKDASESIGEYTDYPSEIIKVEKYECEYPYELRNIGWTREKYLSDYVPPKEEKPIETPKEETPVEKPIEQPIEEEKTIWQKIIQAIIDILKALLEQKD